MFVPEISELSRSIISLLTERYQSLRFVSQPNLGKAFCNWKKRQFSFYPTLVLERFNSVVFIASLVLEAEAFCYSEQGIFQNDTLQVKQLCVLVASCRQQRARIVKEVNTTKLIR